MVPAGHATSIPFGKYLVKTDVKVKIHGLRDAAHCFTKFVKTELRHNDARV